MERQLPLFSMPGLPRKRRKPDPLWNAWVRTWGEPETANQRGRINDALGQLRAISATPEQVERALRSYDRLFAGCTRSPQGVTGNWTELLRLSKQPGPRKQDTCSHGVSFFERCQECVDA